MDPRLTYAAKTTYPMLWLWNAPVEGKARRGQPCKIVRGVTPGGNPGKQARSVREGSIEKISVQFTDGTTVVTPRRAVRARTWAIEAPEDDNPPTTEDTMKTDQITDETFGPHDFDAWKAQGLTMRAAMETERDELQARLDKLNADLAAFPALSDAKPKKKTNGKAKANGHNKPAKPRNGKNVSALVLAYVKTCSEPLSSSDILEGVRESAPDVDPNSVYSALSALTNKSKKLIASGERGSMMYAERQAAGS